MITVVVILFYEQSVKKKSDAPRGAPDFIMISNY